MEGKREGRRDPGRDVRIRADHHRSARAEYRDSYRYLGEALFVCLSFRCLSSIISSIIDTKVSRLFSVTGNATSRATNSGIGGTHARLASCTLQRVNLLKFRLSLARRCPTLSLPTPFSRFRLPPNLSLSLSLRRSSNTSWWRMAPWRPFELTPPSFLS